jgi:hypothetical protein
MTVRTCGMNNMYAMYSTANSNKSPLDFTIFGPVQEILDATQEFIAYIQKECVQTRELK